MWRLGCRLTLRQPQFGKNSGWDVPNAHGAFLDVTLQLGLVGFGITVTRLQSPGSRPEPAAGGGSSLGWFSLMLIVGPLFSAFRKPGWDKIRRYTSKPLQLQLWIASSISIEASPIAGSVPP